MGIRKYLGIYREFIATSFSEATSYRLHFILLILMDLVFYATVLATVSFIYDHVEMIGPWDRARLMFFMSFMLAVDHLHMTFVSESFWVLSHKIKSGELDFDILKPVNSIFNIFFRHIRPSSLCNIFVTTGLLIYYGRQVPLEPWNWIALPILVVLAFLLLSFIEFIVATSMFWVTEGLGINFLRMQMQQLARWPDFVYASLSRKVLTVGLPLLLIGSAPVRFLFDASQWVYMLGMLLAIVVCLWVLSRMWKAGLARYDSASS
jgi:ABC-2 type transport system permease protein